MGQGDVVDAAHLGDGPGQRLRVAGGVDEDVAGWPGHEPRRRRRSCRGSSGRGRTPRSPARSPAGTAAGGEPGARSCRSTSSGRPVQPARRRSPRRRGAAGAPPRRRRRRRTTRARARGTCRSRCNACRRTSRRQRCPGGVDRPSPSASTVSAGGRPHPRVAGSGSSEGDASWRPRPHICPEPDEAADADHPDQRVGHGAEAGLLTELAGDADHEGPGGDEPGRHAHGCPGVSRWRRKRISCHNPATPTPT